ncbi:MAG TPA: periplasmic heavy metal sensor [Gemmatimonadales bacterium]
MDDLLNGRGAGFARTAELNGYPGPRHVLDRGDHLTLSAEQRTSIEAIFAAMQTDATRLGAEIVDRERALAAAFAQRTVSPGSLAARVDTLGTLYARLRARHLGAHIETTALLTPEQIGRYSEMRWYEGEHAH